MKRHIDDALFSYRRLNLLGLFIAGVSLGYATIVLDQQLSAIDCTLCQIVRLCLLSISGIFLIAFILNPWIFGQRLLAFLSLIIAGIGLATAGRYVWLTAQKAPPLLCDTGLQEWLLNSPYLQDIEQFIVGKHDCLPDSMALVGIPVERIALLVFILLFFITWRLLIRRPITRAFF
ncbi:disulfide bond formation protein B [Neptunomonas concharum]|uniref:Disulfide bond formation protein B n=1 Tax=Neptunomonas concharum TaxID=1031538 RepID=A0A5P1R923_9GAMM|nr:disulfide bond formation protein B [Neptunomonas concharum]QEQ96149.1 disulfide bond formation protein B [Neptunomonas concharum]